MRVAPGLHTNLVQLQLQSWDGTGSGGLVQLQLQSWDVVWVPCAAQTFPGHARDLRLTTLTTDQAMGAMRCSVKVGGLVKNWLVKNTPL